MISYEDARRIALAHIGPDCALVDSAATEKRYGWYFCGQSRAYLQTGDVNDMLVGSSGFIVERADGRLFVFGSAYPAEQWIANYERGFKYERYDLTIRAVSDVETAAGLLGQLDMQYVVPERDGGTVWRIPRQYTRGQIRGMLGHLPCMFAGQAFWHRVEVFYLIDRSGCCEYELREHGGESVPAEHIIYGPESQGTDGEPGAGA